MAGREDFKKDMAQKIAAGEMTPEKLVEEITVMAEEINASANVAVSAQMEVQKLLEETREIQQRLELPSAEESTLVELKMAAEEQKVPLNLVSEESAEKLEEIPMPMFAVEQVDTIEPDIVIDDNEQFEVPVLQVNVDSKQNPFQAIADEIVEEVDHPMEIDNDDANLIADALLATPPSMRNKPSDSLNESDALKLAQEALASVSELQIAEDGMDPVPPSPPAVEPPIDLVRNSIDSETGASAEKQPIKVDTADQTTKPDGPIRSSPLARLLCSELGVDLADVYPGSGLKGRVVADDVRRYAAAMQEV